MFAKGLGLLISLIGVFWLAIAGGYAVYRYDRAPAGWPNYKLMAVPFVHPVLHLPGVGAVTVARASAVRAQADLKTCRGNEATLKGALDRQNAAVTAMHAAGEQMQRHAQAATARARAQHQADVARARQILAEKAPANETEIETCRRADGYLKEGAQ